MNLKLIATMLGVLLMTIGVLGFIPALTPGGFLLGVFKVTWVHNVFHLGTGLLAIVTMSHQVLAQRYFQALGLLYGIMAASGFLTGYGFLATMPVNMADTTLYFWVAVLAIYVGFVIPYESYVSE